MLDAVDESDELRVSKTLGELSKDIDRAVARLRAYLEHAVAELSQAAPDFRYRFVETRDKKPREVARAIEEQNLTSDQVLEIDDLIGGRVVVVSPSDVREFAGYLVDDPGSPIQTAEAEAIDDDSGYRATHVKGRISCGAFVAGCEIQIRTALADAWAVVSRADIYRRSDLARLLPKLAQTQARALAAADDALELIREESKRPSPAEPTGEPKPPVLPSEPVVVTDVEISRDSVPNASDDEVYIITHPLSHDRVDAFYEEFLKDREQTASGEKVFRRADAFAVSDDWKDEVAAGFNVLLHRGPFVDGASWAPYRTWQFAVAGEQHLLNRLDTLLRNNAVFSDAEVRLNWKDIFVAVDNLRARLNSPSLVVVTGRLPTELMVDLHNHVVPEWELDQDLRALWIEGAYDGIPILNIRDDDAPYALFVVDLREFATLTRYSPRAKLTVQAIDHVRAREVLAKRPDAVKVPDGRPDNETERILHLLLHVQVLMYESYEIKPGNSAAALGARLTPPPAT